MTKFVPNKLTQHLRLVISEMAKADHNHPVADVAYEFYIGKTLESLAKQYKENAAKAIKAAFDEKLAMPSDETHELVLLADLSVFGKVGNPRKMFDKGAFIKALVDRYNLPAAELHAIAAQTVKESAPIVTLSVEAR